MTLPDAPAPFPSAFVTGASSGTGRAIAVSLGAAGYQLVLVGRDRTALSRTGDAAGTPFHVAEADLRDAEATQAALAGGLTWTRGRADVLVNAAGITGPLGDPVGELAVAAFDETIAVNLRAPFLTLSALLPVMTAQRAGRVVTIGGTHGQRGRPGRAAYVASKWGLRGLHRSAAIEVGPQGVAVNMVMPGPIRNPRMEGVVAARGRSAGHQLRRRARPVYGANGRRHGPAELARRHCGRGPILAEPSRSQHHRTGNHRGRRNDRMRYVALLAAMLMVMPVGLSAKELRVGNAVDTATMDPHGSTETNTLGTILNIYEGLVRRSATMAIEPSLAESWTVIDPKHWRFKLRHAVFQDGTPFTADDVAFSFTRANAATSEARAAVRTIAKIDVVAPDTIDIFTTAPDPILLAELCNFFIMSRKWSEANHSEVPYNPTRNAGTENYATRHANGTGPYMLESYGAGQGVTLVANPTWWDHPEGNVTRATLMPITNDATRVAALLSNSVDVIIPVPDQAAAQLAQRPDFKVWRGSRLAVMYLGMDEGRSELLYSDVKGKNPFADVRVRQAMTLAIDHRRATEGGAAQFRQPNRLPHSRRRGRLRTRHGEAGLT